MILSNLTPRHLAAAAAAAVQVGKGTSTAPDLRVFGFTLGATTPSDVSAWQKQHSVACESKRQDSWVQCTQIAASALGTSGNYDELNLQFHPDSHKLVGITAYRFALEPAAAVSTTLANRDALSSHYGPAHTSFGNAENFQLMDGATLTQSYRFSDLAVDLTGSRIAGRGTTLALSFQAVQ